MNQKVLLTSVSVASVVLALAYVFIGSNGSAGHSVSQQQSVPKTSMNEQWAPIPKGFQVSTGTVSARSAQPAESDSAGETAINLSGLSPIESGKQEILNGLSNAMQAMYAQSQEQDLASQQKLMQEVEHPSDDRKLPAEQQRLLSAAVAQLPGADVNSEASNIDWQPVEDEFVLPDDERFYGAEVDQACADEMCKLQFRGFGNEGSRDSAIEKLIADKKIPQGSMVVPDDNDSGRFVVIYPKGQSEETAAN